MDFGLLPPEVNSGRLYVGPGSGPMLAAAGAWDGLALQMHITAGCCESAIAGLVAQWHGPSSATMSVAAASYTTWLTATAVRAEQAAEQARAAVAAYEAAYVATVPPAVVAANRTKLLALIATNFFGQNLPAIMTTEVQYAEMWAQDAAAMYGYAAGAAAATRVTPFSPAPPVTAPGGSVAQAGAVAQAAGAAAATQAHSLPALMTAVPQALHSLAGTASAAAPAAAADAPSLLSALNTFITGPLTPVSLAAVPIVPELLGVQSYLTVQSAANLTRAAEQMAALPAGGDSGLLEAGLGSGTRLVGSANVAAVSAGVGRAGLVGGLAVPPSWVTTAPEVKAAAAAVTQSSAAAPAALAADADGGLFGNMALSSLAGRAVAGVRGSAAESGNPRSDPPALREIATTSNIFVIPEADVIPEVDE